MKYSQKPNIFFGLTKYSDTKFTTQLENQFTESIAYLLSKDSKLFTFFLNKLVKEKLGKREKAIITQSREKLEDRDRVPDIKILGEQLIVLIENKINSQLESKQINRYLKILNDSEANKKYMVIITRKAENLNLSDKKIKIRYIRWIDVYNILSNYLHRGYAKAESLSKLLIKDFLLFMEDKGMKPFETIISDELNAWKKTKALIEKIRLVIDEIQIELKKRKYICSKVTTSHESVQMRFRPAKVNQKKWIKKGLGKNLKIMFSLDFDKEDEELYVWCSFYFRTSAKYFEEYIETSKAKKRVYKNLENKGFEIINRRIFEKSACLAELIENTMGEKQKEKIVGFFMSALDDLEASGLLNIIYKTDS